MPQPAIGGKDRTSLVFPKLNWLVQGQLVSVHFGVEAIVRLQHDGQVARTDVNRTPRRHSFFSVDLGLDILEMTFTKASDRTALFEVSMRTLGPLTRTNSPG